MCRGRPERRSREVRGACAEWCGVLGGMSHPQPTNGSGERRELPSWVRGEAPAASAFSAYSRPQKFCGLNEKRSVTERFSCRKKMWLWCSMNYWYNNNFLSLSSPRWQRRLATSLPCWKSIWHHQLCWVSPIWRKFVCPTQHNTALKTIKCNKCRFITTCKAHHWVTHIKQQKLVSSHHGPRI